MRRLIIVIVIFVLFLTFIVLNVDNKCDVSIGFRTFTDIPVFISIFFSFALGMLFAVPLVASLGKKKKNSVQVQSVPPSGEKKRRWGFKKIKDGQSSGSDEIKKEDSSYGID